MFDYTTSFLGLFFGPEYQMLLMFFSAFLSSTLLPGNSEIIFSTLISQNILINKQAVFFLWFFATLGNSLGSLTTYWMAYLIPKPNINDHQSKTTQWALRNSQKYGVWILLLSWLPVVGDLLCGIAGWLRFNMWQTILFIIIGKGARYAMILWGIWAIIG
ncbi:hypothetical protein A1D22_07970 [Pasteurellaceae bacterium LFhippo2]|nr:hypothetical protein [Pasteurellaceae bacterium LFhippo2]